MSSSKDKPKTEIPNAERVGPSLNQVVASKKASDKPDTPSRSIIVTAAAKRRRAGFSFAAAVPVTIEMKNIDDKILKDLMSDPVLHVELNV